VEGVDKEELKEAVVFEPNEEDSFSTNLINEGALKFAWGFVFIGYDLGVSGGYFVVVILGLGMLSVFPWGLIIGIPYVILEEKFRS